MTPTQQQEQLINIVGLFKQARDEKGLSQQKLSELSGIGIATIKRFESGKTWINLKQYITLCHHLR